MKTGIAFDWVGLLDSRGIHYKDRGSGVKRGNVYIDCPWCETSGKHHLGVSITSSVYGCWKAPKEHGGINPIKLVKHLLGISFDAARSICLEYAPDGLNFEKWNHVNEDPKDRVVPKPYLPPEGVSKKFPQKAIDYLNKRDISLEIFKQLGGWFGGTVFSSHPFAWRVGLPLIRFDGMCVGATGRAIGSNGLRYLTLPDASTISLEVVCGGHWCQEGRALIGVEGPFDAIKLKIAALEEGLPYDAVAIRGLGFPDETRDEFYRIATRYDGVVWILDDKEFGTALHFAREAPGPAIAAMIGNKDPGALTVQEARRMLRELDLPFDLAKV